MSIKIHKEDKYKRKIKYDEVHQENIDLFQLEVNKKNLSKILFESDSNIKIAIYQFLEPWYLEILSFRNFKYTFKKYRDIIINLEESLEIFREIYSFKKIIQNNLNIFSLIYQPNLITKSDMINNNEFFNILINSCINVSDHDSHIQCYNYLENYQPLFRYNPKIYNYITEMQKINPISHIIKNYLKTNKILNDGIDEDFKLITYSQEFYQKIKEIKKEILNFNSNYDNIMIEFLSSNNFLDQLFHS